MRKSKGFGGLKLTNKGDIYTVTTLDAVVYGVNGNDRITGGDGNDQLHGGNGKDRLCGGAGDDQLYGGNGMDTLHGGFGNDFLHGGNGKDVAKGGWGDDRLHGGNGGDILCGGAGADLICGGNGADWISGGYGRDVMSGGLGPDRFRWNDADVTTISETDPSYPQGVLSTSEGDPASGDAAALNVWVRGAADGGAVGVTEDYANAGYGSLLLSGGDPSNDGGYIAGASYSWDPLAGLDTIDDGGAIDDTTLGSLSALGYDWYRDSSSTSPESAVPVLSLLVDLDGDMTTTADRIALTYDPAAGSTVTEDQWNSASLDFSDPSQINFGSQFGAINLGTALDTGITINDGVSDIGTLNSNSFVYGVEVGIGGTTGELTGAVDNIAIGFHNDTPQTWNFEVGPSEPDIIVDFTSHVDKLVVRDLLTGFAPGSDIDDFVQATTDAAGDTTVFVNEDGIGTDWTAFVVLKGATIDLATDVIA